MALSVEQYDVLERAVANGSRVAITRRGVQWVVVVERLVVAGGRETLKARHPSTGDAMTFAVDDIQRLEVIR